MDLLRRRSEMAEESMKRRYVSKETITFAVSDSRRADGAVAEVEEATAVSECQGGNGFKT